MTQPKLVIKDWIERINDEGRGLTQWELSFMESYYGSVRVARDVCRISRKKS